MAACNGTPSPTATTPATPTPEEGIKASCSVIPGHGYCVNYHEPAFAIGEAVVQGSCKLLAGTWESRPCPTSGVVGRCTIEGGQVRVYYADAGEQSWDADSARKECDTYEGTLQ